MEREAKREINRVLIGRINADIYSIMELTSKVGWVGVRPISIYRILYLTSVLYSFRYPQNDNPFIVDYNFSTSLRGPYYEEIEKSINYLLTNQIIKKDEENDLFILIETDIAKSKIKTIEEIPGYLEKKDWMRIIIYILGIYGEDKIYDFIFRDPEYQKSLKRNSKTPINTNNDNETIDVLNRFKQTFEKKLGEESKNLDSIKYLKLYFEYVFSVILKGEADL